MRHTEGGIISIAANGSIFLIFNMVCRPDLVTLLFTVTRAMERRIIMDDLRQSLVNSV